MDKPFSELDRNELNRAFALKLEPDPSKNPDEVLLTGEYQLSPKRAWESVAWYYAHQQSWSPRDFCHPSISFWIISRLPDHYEIFLLRNIEKKNIWICQIADHNNPTPIGMGHFIPDQLAETQDADPGCAIIRALLYMAEQRSEIIGEVSRFLCSDEF